jgi:hypothetical protein
MKRQFYFLAALFTLTFNADAQTAIKPRQLKKAITLQMALTEEDDMPGKRGASVVWHPLQKKYYAAMAGNIGYPLCVFNAVGKRISKDDHITEADVRGMWYHPTAKAIQGNAYSDNGWFQYKLNLAGMVQELEELQSGMNQPNGQCVGAYRGAKKQVLFLGGSQLFFYDEVSAGAVDSMLIHFGRKKADGPLEDADPNASPEAYNYTTVVFTGIKGAELGFLNVTDKQIELYDVNSGFLTQVLKLPADATSEASFNFAYTNGAYWLFDMEKRVWTGYK